MKLRMLMISVTTLFLAAPVAAQVQTHFRGLVDDSERLTQLVQSEVSMIDVALSEYVHRYEAEMNETSGESASRNPYFARRQVTGCNSCHVAIPKLNTYGRLVKNLGYELPELDLSGHEEFGLKKMSRYVPLAVRGIVDFANGNPSNVSGDLDVRALQILGGSSLFDNRVSWWLHTHLVEENEFQNPFDNVPHELWAQYNLHLGQDTRVGLRGGMAELPLWFAPSKTKLSEIPYAAYDAALGESQFTLSRPQFGITLNGARLNEWGNDLNYSWALSAVNGQGDFSSTEFTRLFARVTKTFSQFSVGTFGFFGTQDVLVEHDDGHVHDEAQPAEAVTDRLFRIGVDLETNIGPVNIFGMGLYGRNSNPMGMEVASSQSYYGGFVGADLSIGERFIVSSRYDGVRFRGLPMVDEHAHADEAAHDEGHADPEVGHEAGGHLHGELVTADTDALVFGVNYLLTWQLRATTEYRRAFGGLENKWIAGLQFAF